MSNSKKEETLEEEINSENEKQKFQEFVGFNLGAGGGFTHLTAGVLKETETSKISEIEQTVRDVPTRTSTNRTGNVDYSQAPSRGYASGSNETDSRSYQTTRNVGENRVNIAVAGVSNREENLRGNVFGFNPREENEAREDYSKAGDRYNSPAEEFQRDEVLPFERKKDRLK